MGEATCLINTRRHYEDNSHLDLQTSVLNHDIAENSNKQSFILHYCILRKTWNGAHRIHEMPCLYSQPVYVWPTDVTYRTLNIS